MDSIFRVAVVLETFADYGRALLRGVASFVTPETRWQLYCSPLRLIDSDLLRQAMRADGVITWLDPQQLEEVSPEPRVPLVAMHYRGQLALPTVDNDNQRIGQLAADHFVEQGFRNFGYFGPAGIEYAQIRANCFIKELAQRGFSCNVLFADLSSADKFIWHTPDAAVVNWLRALPKPSGVLVSNDIIGQQLLQNAVHAAIRIPDEVAVIGVDNDDLICNLTNPPLSSIDIAGERVGFEAARLLQRLLRGESVEHRRIYVQPGQLVVRQSSDVLAVNDPVVADAVHFIRQNVSKCLSVDDVMFEVPVARRTLERAFQRCLGRSIHQEIIDSRLRCAKKMLVETNVPISAISEACGFSSRAHLDAAFSRHTGQPPGTYRRNLRASETKSCS